MNPDEIARGIWIAIGGLLAVSAIFVVILFMVGYATNPCFWGGGNCWGGESEPPAPAVPGPTGVPVQAETQAEWDNLEEYGRYRFVGCLEGEVYVTDHWRHLVVVVEPGIKVKLIGVTESAVGPGCYDLTATFRTRGIYPEDDFPVFWFREATYLGPHPPR